MARQWSLFVKWREPLHDQLWISQFKWVEGQGGYQIEYTYSPLAMQSSEPVKYIGTETFAGFAKWAMQCVKDVDGEVIMPVGCPSCGTIDNAHHAACDDLWHEANQSSMWTLQRYMRANFPEAVEKAKGDEALAAIHLMMSTREVVTALWPMLVKQFQAAVAVLRQAGVDLPSS